MRKIKSIIESETPPVSMDGGLWVHKNILKIQRNGEWEALGGDHIELAQEEGQDPNKATSQKGFTKSLNTQFEYAEKNYSPKMRYNFIVIPSTGFITLDLIDKTSHYDLNGECKKLSITGGTATNFAQNVSIITGKWSNDLDTVPLDLGDTLIKLFDKTVPVPGEYFEITIFNNFVKLTNTDGHK